MNARTALRRRCARPVAVALVTWASAATVITLPGAPVVAVVCGLSSVLTAALFAWRRRAVIGVCAVALACAAAAAAGVAFVDPIRDDVAGMRVDGGRHLEVAVVATGRLSVSNGGDVWFDAVASSLAAGPRHLGGPIPVRVGAPGDARRVLADVGPGSEILLRGTAFAPDGPDRAVLVVRVAEVVRAAPPSGVWSVFEALRDGLVASTSTLPGPGAGLVPGLAVGDTTALDAATEQAMTDTSLSHLTAVSGANCAIVVGAVFAGLALCRAPRWLRVAGACVALVAFVGLVTPEPSVVRAATMAVVAMLAVVLGRPAMGVAVLAAAVTVVLIVDPWTALSLGFGLSAAATAALLLLARPLARGLERWMPRTLALALAVPTAAQLACGPLIILIDPHVPVLGVVANLLADPAAAPATILGALACLAPFPWLRDGLAVLAWIPASWIAGVAHVAAGVGAQNLPWVQGLPGAALLALVGTALCLVILRPTRLVRPWRPVAAAIVAVTVGVVAGQTAVRTVAGSLTLPADWQIAMCDVGQGDATLWRSDGQVALVDTGADPAALEACLRRLGVDRVSLLVLTHFDLDHVGGSAAVVGRVDTVLHGPTSEPPDERVLSRLAHGGARVERAAAGVDGVLGGTRWTVLWPDDPGVSGNDASLVLDVSGLAFPRTMLLGDLGAKPQKALGRRIDVPRVQVVKVSHHGSADQDPAFYGRLAADVGLIGVGADNTYGHPTETLLSTLAALGTTVGRTDTDGALAVWAGADGRLSLWREKHSAPLPLIAARGAGDDTRRNDLRAWRHGQLGAPARHAAHARRVGGCDRRARRPARGRPRSDEGARGPIAAAADGATSRARPPPGELGRRRSCVRGTDRARARSGPPATRADAEHPLQP